MASRRLRLKTPVPESPALRSGRVRGVVFDLDGTLVDGYLGITTGVNAARAAFGLPPMTIDDVKGRVGLGLEHLMEDVVGAARASAGARVFREVYERVCERETRAMPGLEVVLRTLRQRDVRMSVASNKPASFSIRILAGLGVRDCFDTIEGPETIGAIKPDPAMLEACLAAMSVGKDEALYVGDMTIDAETGSRAGVRVVLVAGGSSSRSELLATGCPVVDDLSGLVRFLD